MRYSHCGVTSIALAVALFWLCSCGGKAKQPPSYAMGQGAAAGHLVYTAFETQWLNRLGEGTDARIPQNRFFAIRMTIHNQGGGSAMVPNFAVEDDAGNSYAEQTDGGQLAQWMGILRQVNPGDTLQGTVLFDVAPRHYKLRVYDENSQQSVLIDIPLTFSQDSPSGDTKP